MAVGTQLDKCPLAQNGNYFNLQPAKTQCCKGICKWHTKHTIWNWDIAMLLISTPESPD